MSKQPSLDDFAENDRDSISGYRSKIDQLCPDDVKSQLLASKAGHSTAGRWLKSLGYEINAGQVQNWRGRNGWTRD